MTSIGHLRSFPIAKHRPLMLHAFFSRRAAASLDFDFLTHLSQHFTRLEFFWLCVRRGRPIGSALCATTVLCAFAMREEFLYTRTSLCFINIQFAQLSFPAAAAAFQRWQMRNGRLNKRLCMRVLENALFFAPVTYQLILYQALALCW